MTPTQEAENSNRETLNELWDEVASEKAGWQLSDDWGGAGSEATTHRLGSISLERLRKLLAEYEFPAADNDNWIAAQLAIDRHLQGLPQKVAVLLIGNDGKKNSTFRRERTLEKGHRIALFQGEGKQGARDRYVGDRQVRFEKQITLQIHCLDLFPEKGGPVGAASKPKPPTKHARTASAVLAIALPTNAHKWARGVIVEQ